MTRCSDSRGTEEEEVELDGEAERRRDGWRLTDLRCLGRTEEEKRGWGGQSLGNLE